VNSPASAALPPDYPADLERTWHAADGTPVRIRPLRPDDLDRELKFVTELSEQTRYLRLHYTATEFSRDDAARLLDLDYRDSIAIGALVGDGPDAAIVGVSRYARGTDAEQAECAIVVADAWHGRGVGTELMRTLGIAARRNGIRSLVGASLAENHRIHAWARRFGFDVRTEPNSGGQMRVTLDLSSFPS
jgi:acetyltransferase